MSNAGRQGVRYTEYSRLVTQTPFLSVWSYRSQQYEVGRPAVVRTAAGDHEFWLDRTDPLLNTILPGTALSVVVNLGDAWAAGRTLASTEVVPALCVMGPVTRPRAMRVGPTVRAVGAVLPAALAMHVLSCRPGDLVDRTIPLDAIWARHRILELLDAVCRGDDASRAARLRDVLLASTNMTRPADVTATAARLMTLRGGDVSVEAMAARCALSRQQFTRRFRAATGLPPKKFARISRFQRLVHTLLTTDVERWGFEAPGWGFYDQSHMVNEFRAFAGVPPIRFFRPRGLELGPAEEGRLRGRPHTWWDRRNEAQLPHGAR